MLVIQIIAQRALLHRIPNVINLDVRAKGQCVSNYHNSMVHHLVELLEVAGLSTLGDIRSHHVNHRVGGSEVKTFADIYPEIKSGALLQDSDAPEGWKADLKLATANSW